MEGRLRQRGPKLYKARRPKYGGKTKIRGPKLYKAREDETRRGKQD